MREAFLKELAHYIFENDCRYSYKMVDAVCMSDIARKYDQEALLVYLMQFNYEDCETPRDIIECLINNTK